MKYPCTGFSISKRRPSTQAEPMPEGQVDHQEGRKEERKDIEGSRTKAHRLLGTPGAELSNKKRRLHDAHPG